MENQTGGLPFEMAHNGTAMQKQHFRKEPAEIVPSAFRPFLRGKSYGLHLLLVAHGFLGQVKNTVSKREESIFQNLYVFS